MPAERVPMRQVCEILRLTFSGDVAGREVARRLGIAPSTGERRWSASDCRGYAAVRFRMALGRRS